LAPLIPSRILYAFPVFCIAYPLRRNGRKLPKNEVRAGGKRGWLTFARMPAGQPVWTAKLSGPHGGDIFPELSCARVTAISEGIVIAGLVLRPGEIQPTRQAWYCMPAEAPPDEVPPARMRPGRRG
jgi:hypothetical protein